METPIEKLLPHRAPMVMLDTVIETGDDWGRAAKTFAADGYGVEGGLVAEPLLIEGLAQTVAALEGLDAQRRGLPPAAGLLVGVTDFVFHAPAHAGAAIEFEVKVTRRLPPFVFAEGRATQNGALLAEGGMKFYIEGTYDAAKMPPS